MFQNFSVDSLNTFKDISDGIYHGWRDVLEVKSLNLSIAISFYSLEHDDDYTVVDMIAVFDDGRVLFRDFIKRADGFWRDSHGAYASELVDLLPPEINLGELVDGFKLEPRNV